MAKTRGPEILTANEIRTGRIVFWTGSGWSDGPRDALVAATDEQKAALATTGRTEEQRNTVVSAYLFEIDAATGEPVELRERRRIAGPSVPLPTPIRTAA